VAPTNDLKNGLVLRIDGNLWAVTEFQHVKPGKGGAFVRTTLQNVMTGKVVDKTFNAGTKVETANVDRRDMTFLYRDGDDFVINGQKIWTSGADVSDWIVLVARTDPEAPKHKGISFFLADMKTPGITVAAEPAKDQAE